MGGAGWGQGHPWRGYAVLSLVWLAVTVVVWMIARQPAAEPVRVLAVPTLLATAAPSPRPSRTATPGLLRVDVAGAVQTPGVYRLPPGSIVADAILAAGGPKDSAALDRINKAAPLADGIQVYVPSATQTIVPLPLNGPTPAASTGGRGSTARATPAQPVNVNGAPADELTTVPGIGPAMAARIVAARPFSSLDDLRRVPGIGPATLAKIRPYLTVQ